MAVVLGYRDLPLFIDTHTLSVAQTTGTINLVVRYKRCKLGPPMNRARNAALLLLVLQPVLFFRTALIHPTKHLPYDIAGFHTPLADYIAWTADQGRFPLWDPNPYCGYPIHADVQAQLFYPPAWLAYLGRRATRPETTLYWLQWLEVLHVMLAGLLTFWLLRKRGASKPAAYLGATVFQLGAFFVSQPQHLGAMCGAAWMPLAWLAVLELRERFSWRWFGALAIALSLTFLAGFTAITLVAFFSTAVVLLASRPKPLALFWFALAVLAVVPLTAVQLFPTLALTEWSVAGLRALWNQGAGTPPKAWMSFFWPNYHEVFHPFDSKLFHGDYEFTFLYCYSGIAAVAGVGVAIFRRNARVWVALAILFAILQCGNRLPGFDPVFQRLPSAIRGALYADFFLAAACLAIAIATGMVFARLPDRVVWIVGIATAAELILVASNRPMNVETGSWKTVSASNSINGDRDSARRLTQIVNQDVPQPRLDVVDLNFSLTMGASLRRLPTPNGDSPFAPRRIVEFRRLFAKGDWWERQLPVAKPGSPLLDFLNVRFLAAAASEENKAELASLGWEPVRLADWLRLYQSTRAQPRFFFVDRLEQASSPQQALERVQTLDLMHEAVVEGGPVEPIGRPGDVKVLGYSANLIQLATTGQDAGFLVSSDSHHPDWHATIDGQQAPILLTNYAFRGLRVPAGKHRIEMRYEPAYFRLYAALSGLSWLIFVFLILRTGRPLLPTPQPD